VTFLFYDRNTPFAPSNRASTKVAQHILDFSANEVRRGRLPHNLPPLQSGVGIIANTMLIGLRQGP
jgi:succinyl-CoA:acetate CoA-transferase